MARRRINRDRRALDRLVKTFEKRFQLEARAAIKMLWNELEKGVPAEIAVQKLGNIFSFEGLEDALFIAACDGYGINPQTVPIMTREAWGAALAKAWNSDGMTLSKRLHGASLAMRNAIIDTLTSQMKANKTWKEAARALYDGYGYGHVIRGDTLPKYMAEAVEAARAVPGAVGVTGKALAQVKRLSRNGAPTTALKVAYKKLLDAAETGTEKALANALKVAVNEKSRHIADRIARTELARAWGDGFFLRVKDDPLVVAVKWRLNRDHPRRDICDVYANADLFGLGPGVYPKDRAPAFPAHPHCLCKLYKVVRGTVDPDDATDRTTEGVNDYLEKLNARQRAQVLGVRGAHEWENGKGFEDHLKLKFRPPETRLAGR